jgi:tetratricopeptide (TPR) repeat protein
MAIAPLRETEYYAARFRRYILSNLQFWLDYVSTHKVNIAELDEEWESVIRAISFALELEEGWSPAYKLITAFSFYMERQGYWRTWTQILSRAVEIAQHTEDLADNANLSVSLALILQRQGCIKEAITHYRLAIRMARQDGARFTEARAYTNLGYLYIERCFWRRAEVLCCRALAIFEAVDNNYGRAHTENHLGLLYTWQQRWGRARACLERACAIWETEEDKHGLMRGFINFSVLYLKRGQPHKAMNYLEKALYQAQQTGEGTEVGTIYMNMGLAYRLKGDLKKAEIYAKQAEAIFRRYSNATGLAQVLDNLGVVYLHQGDWQKAFFYLESSLQVWRNLGSKIGEIEVLIDMIDCELARGNRQQAMVRLKEVEHLIGQNYAHMRYDNIQLRLAKYCRSLTDETDR